MRGETVMLVHNRYRERGGEESVYEAEGRLLERHGHRVVRYEQDSHDTERMGVVQLAARSVWSVSDHRAIGDTVQREGVRLVHFHNTFPLISPSAHHAARQAGAAVVQTLHNFRLLCPGGLLLRNGAPCEKCVGQSVPWAAVTHRCYRGSAAASAVVAGMLTAHRALGTWQNKVDAFIALSRFARERFVAGGLPDARIFVNAGAVELPDDVVTGEAGGDDAGNHFLYAGRLETEKGIEIVLDAWARLSVGIELRIVGDGALSQRVRNAANHDPRILWLGRLPREEVLQQMKAARALVFPSLCYENFPGVLAEAQAMGLPVVASDLGSGAEVVSDGGFGILFEAGDAGALADAVLELAGNAVMRAELSRRARARYEETLTPAQSYGRLLRIYESALAHRHDESDNG